MKIRSLTIVAAAFIITAVSAPALAVYHPGMGRFLQRDPHGTMNAPTAPRIGMAGSAAGGGFVARDPMPTRPQPGLQYADGMNLYQYLRSNPLRYVDPSGEVIVIIPPRGGRGNPFHHQFGPNRGRFASRDAYRDQVSRGGGSRVTPSVHPGVMLAVNQAADYIAKWGYNKYLEQADDIESYGKATMLCRELQLKDAMGELDCNRRAFTAYQAAGGIEKPNGTTTRVRIVGIYHVNIVPDGGTCYATAFHFERVVLDVVEP